jgi:hypothetical protein
MSKVSGSPAALMIRNHLPGRCTPLFPACTAALSDAEVSGKQFYYSSACAGVEYALRSRAAPMRHY